MEAIFTDGLFFSPSPILHPTSKIFASFSLHNFLTTSPHSHFSQTRFSKFSLFVSFTLHLQSIVVLYPSYPVEVGDDLFTYEFHSEGTTGRIRKLILYERLGENLFNLAFGDWNKEQSKLDDSSRTNNGDRDKVLMPVAFTALDFTIKFPNALLLIEGSTPGRTRLYQMSIGNNLHEINKYFNIQGLRRQNWEPFTRGINYETLLAQRK